MNSIPNGTLNDVQIQRLCEEQGTLIRRNFERLNIKQACYELRASNIYYELDENEKKIDISVTGHQYILIKPKQSVVIISMEELELPNNIIARILSKGKLFSIGLLPVNTYADPGFSGNLGIVFYNSSHDFIKILPGESIAKIEFSKLEVPVARDYEGQHGYQTQIWPIPKEMRLTENEIKDDSRILKIDDEIIRMFGLRFTDVIYRLFKFEKVLIFSAIAYVFFSILLISSAIYLGKKEWLDPLYTILLGLISNVITAFVMFKFLKTNK
jgi:dCTP deaminase